MQFGSPRDSIRTGLQAEMFVIYRSIVAVALAFLFAADAHADDVKPAYRIVASIPLGSPERWDFVTYDPASKRAYVAHGERVTVVDTTAKSVVGIISPLPGGSHGIAIAPENGIGFTDDGKGGTVAVFDPSSLKITSTLPAAPDADGIVRDPVSGHLFVINGDSGSITVIDPKTPKVVATITAGAGLEIGAPDGKGHFYVDGEENNEILTINTKTNAIEAHWPMPACKTPHGLAMDTATRRLFATCGNQTMVIVDADTGKTVATLPIGAFNDGVVFDPARKVALASNGDGTLTVVKEEDADKFVVQDTVKTAPSARTIAIDPASGRIFLPAADVASITPPAQPGGRPKVTFVPGSLKLLILDPN
jgi:YVTN family beta-propeller protein